MNHFHGFGVTENEKFHGIATAVETLLLLVVFMKGVTGFIDGRHGGILTFQRGKYSVNVVPDPSSESTVILPW